MSSSEGEKVDEDKHLRASEARALSNQQLSRQREEGARHRQEDAAIARKLADKFLAEIEKRAAGGHTDAYCSIIEWRMRAHDRDDVVQQIVRHIDALGFNVLSVRESSIFGNKAIFKIEW